MNNLKMIIVAGARPNFMKIAPLMKRIVVHNAQSKPDRPRIEPLLVHTGQHYDTTMSEVFFRDLGIRRPDINLGVGSGTHAVQTARVLTRFETVCEQEKPDWVVVVGDVNSTLSCTLACAKMGIRVAHVEAGLRSFDRAMPEEINRVVTDALADLLLTPSEDADANLAREGIAPARVKRVGNIMIDSLVQNLEAARRNGILARFDLEPRRFVYVTLHRPANVDARENLIAILAKMKKLSARLPVVFPVHPRTRKMMAEFGFVPRSGNRLHLLEPIGYHESLRLMENARLVLTDSGGLQEESTFFGTPCLTLRPNTERPITIILGSNRLTGIERLTEDVELELSGPERKGQVPPLWDGHTADRVVDEILAAGML